MRRTHAAAGSALFLAVAPGLVAVLVPWLLTGWDVHRWWLPLRVAGGALAAVGGLVLLEAFARFAVDGVGTPAPPAPTERLVVRGTYRFVRNPMYLAVGATILGQTFLLGRPILLAELAVFAGSAFAFVRLYEEPTLRRRFGAEYEAYAAEVPAWLPRSHASTSSAFVSGGKTG